MLNNNRNNIRRSKLPYPDNVERTVYDMLTRETESVWPVISCVAVKLNDFDLSVMCSQVGLGLCDVS